MVEYKLDPVQNNSQLSTYIQKQLWKPNNCVCIPVDGVLVELAELPVDGEDVHVVVLLEVVSQQVQRVFASLQPLLVLVDLLHLKDHTDTIHIVSARC